jgi:hypothetical protein
MGLSLKVDAGRGSRRDRWSRVAKWTAVMAALAFALGALLWMVFGISRSTVPAPDLGRTWELNYRGRIVYLNDVEVALLGTSFAVFVVGTVASVVLEYVVDRSRRGRR